MTRNANYNQESSDYYKQLKLIKNALIDGDQSIVLFCMYIVLYNAYRRDQSVSYFRGLYDGII